MRSLGMLSARRKVLEGILVRTTMSRNRASRRREHGFDIEQPRHRPFNARNASAHEESTEDKIEGLFAQLWKRAQEEEDISKAIVS